MRYAVLLPGFKRYAVKRGDRSPIGADAVHFGGLGAVHPSGAPHHLQYPSFSLFHGADGQRLEFYGAEGPFTRDTRILSLPPSAKKAPVEERAQTNGNGLIAGPMLLTALKESF